MAAGREQKMTEISRRDVLGGAVLAGGLVAATAAAAQSDSKAAPANQAAAPPPPPAAPLPALRYPLGEKPRQKEYPGGWAKEANVHNFPASVNFAGVLMHLEAGGLRELHWHANAAEWAYVIDGTCRITIIDPKGQSQTVDFTAGDVWYFPRGFGHSIQGLGPTGTTFVLVFNDGGFSEFGTFSITDWLGHTPADVLAKNFKVPEATFADFPKEEVYIALGPVPPALPAFAPVGSLDSSPLTHRYPLLAEKPTTYPGGTLRMVSEREFPISFNMTGVIITLEPGALRELHWHPNADEWQLFLSGTAQTTVFGAGGRAQTDVFRKYDVGYVPRGYGHYIENVGDEDMQVLLVLNSGDYQEISLTQWMASNEHLLLATNFEVPEKDFAGFPKQEVFIDK
jgi:oxalate decarboxylase